MATSGATGTTGGATRTQGSDSEDPTEPTEITEPTEVPEPTVPMAAPSAGEPTDPFAPLAVTTPARSRRRFDVPVVLFLLVLLAAVAGWVFGVVSYLDKEDASATTDQLEAEIADLQARLETLEDEPSDTPSEGELDDPQGQLDTCAEETRAMIELFQDAFINGDISDGALDEQTERVQRACGDIVDGL
jgi:hypothetical protein